ncbi:hypothetical protein [Variovorax sp. GB4R4]
MVTLLLELLDSQPPGRMWIIGQTPSRALSDVLNVALRALMLFGPLTCC